MGNLLLFGADAPHQNQATSLAAIPSILTSLASLATRASESSNPGKVLFNGN